MSTEIEFVRRTIDELIARYHVDLTRVVLHGHQAGGAMAYHVALDHREIARAVAPVAAPLPPGIGNLTTDPVQCVDPADQLGEFLVVQISLGSRQHLGQHGERQLSQSPFARRDPRGHG